MTDYQDYMNTHKLYPDDISRRIDNPPGFDSDRTPKEPLVVPTVKESLTTECEYCNGTEKPLFHENKYEPYESMQSWITISESKESKRHLIEVDLWDGANTYAAFEINYCPMCGRKLEAEG